MSVGLIYKNFAAQKGLSHIGLGVAALNVMKVLRQHKVEANVWPASQPQDVLRWMERSPADHVIVSAPWIPTQQLAQLAFAYPQTRFAVCCHSNVGFLQADRNGVHLIRELMELEQGTHNVHLAGNTTRFCDWIKAAFGKPCAYLPNLYYLDEHSGRNVHHQPVGSSGPLRIGIFGATRPLKNMMTAVAAALAIGRGFRVPLEIWLSAGRAEGGGEVVLSAIREMVAGLPNVTLKANGWQSWPQFRQTVAHMHLLLQPSYTESFNIVTADGCAEGVPSVVSTAIDWVPKNWQEDADDSLAIAALGRRLLLDPHAAHEGLAALRKYVAEGVRAYHHFLAA